MKLVTILGARPQFIKAAAVSRAIQLSKKSIQEVIVHTGQHFDHNMSEIFFEEMGIPKPDYNLDISGLSHGAMTGRMLEKIEEVLFKEKPDLVLVYGDTNSTLAGALAASKLHIPIAHVEAGLRSFNMKMPEEVNRILTDRISNYLFCPTQAAVENLEKEGFANIDCKIFHTGDVMQDAALHHAKQARKPNGLTDAQLANGFVLATIHRAENTNDPTILKMIIESLNTIHNDHLPVIIPVHPRTVSKLKEQSLKLSCHTIEPVGYLEMLYLLQHSRLVMTDSGGLQKEAYFFQKPCVTLREETEWVELVEQGANQITSLNQQSILSAFTAMRDKKLVMDLDLYGGGKAGERIISALASGL
jgi:UDP-GlcNAc3NAcA epimerase